MEYNTDTLIVLLPLLILGAFYVLFCRGTKNSSSKSSNNKNKGPTKPVVTITANHILLDDNMKMDNGTRLSLELLAQHASIFLIIAVKDQDEANSLLEPMAKEFEGIVDKEQILYSQVPLGRASLSRQLEPKAHIDFDAEVILQTAIFHDSILIAPKTVESTHAKWRADNFKDFITQGNTEFFAHLAK